MKEQQRKSALQVKSGVEQPSNVNANSVKNIREKRKNKIIANDYIKEILKGNITILSQAITLSESTLIEHQELSREVIEGCLSHAGKSLRIGISGVPGVGKSTFIEVFGKQFTKQGYKLAVLAIDPSSEKSKGSILGDKTRMEDLANDLNAFIRPSPSSGTLGGVARKTREAIILCEAAGFNVVFVETVGVGQSETVVNHMVDMFLLLMLAGAGDELQGIKRGIMEMADIIAINKADGNNIKKAEIAATQYRNVLHLFPASESGWITKVVTCSSITNHGINELGELTKQYFEQIKLSNYFSKLRNSQSKYWMYEVINEKLKEKFLNKSEVKLKLSELEKKVLSGEISSVAAANLIIDKLK